MKTVEKHLTDYSRDREIGACLFYENEHRYLIVFWDPEGIYTNTLIDYMMKHDLKGSANLSANSRVLYLDLEKCSRSEILTALPANTQTIESSQFGIA